MRSCSVLAKNPTKNESFDDATVRQGTRGEPANMHGKAAALGKTQHTPVHRAESFRKRSHDCRMQKKLLEQEVDCEFFD
jgi:hypothetical protein